MKTTLWIGPVEGRLILNPEADFAPIDRPVQVNAGVFWYQAIRDKDVVEMTLEEAEAENQRIDAEIAKEAEKRAADEKAAEQKPGDEKPIEQPIEQSAEKADEPAADTANKSRKR